MVNLRERRRAVDINSMSEEQFEQVVDMIGQKLKEICDSAVDKANVLAKPYGFKVKMQFHVEPISKE